ncbi:MAG: hypothetical protein Q7S22_02920 [Candidatus Micrarchaeota archaeon]|nr:hypothetical protein [Candidatus Micrarchaeota archaeon]
MDFLSAFVITNVVEISIAYFFLRKSEEIKKVVLTVFLLNCLTLPLVWFVFPFFIRNYLASLLSSEAVIFAIEMFAYQKIFRKSKNAWKIAFVANLVSFLMGLIIP